ncbi:MAG: Pigment production hydroxylase [Microbacteriaceae bacterium]|nr:Pigment production hydroxylase [Microbacteriaceae bacterium]
MTRTTVKPGPIADALAKYGPILDREGAEGARLGRLTDVAVEAFIAGNFTGTSIPKEFGGYGEDSYAEWARVVEEVSRNDGASGWCLQALSGNSGLFIAGLSDEGVKKMFAGPVLPRTAGMAGPRGKAVRVEGGFMVEGKHQFASGSSLATHFIAGSIVYENDKPVMLDNGAPEIIAITMPKDQVRNTGNWDVIGLQASASVDYEIGPVFVPDDQVVHLNPWPDPVQRGSHSMRMGFSVRAIGGHTPVILGIAQRSLEEIAKLAPTRQRKDGPYPAVGDQPHFLHELALREAELHSVRLAMLDYYEQVDDFADNTTGPVGQEWGDRAQQLGRYAHDIAIKAVDFAYEWSGSAGLRQGNVIGRNFLSLHAINQHIIADRYTLIDGSRTVIAELAASTAAFYAA